MNRVSLGVQSFVDSEARGSGRLHNRAVVEDDLRRLRRSGITNLNVDLIAGLAGQTYASWEQSLAALADSGAPHASVYMLEVDEDSGWAANCWPGARATAPVWFLATTPSRGCTSGPRSGSPKPGSASTKSPTSAVPAFTPGTICAIGSGARISGVGLDASSSLRAADHAQSETGSRDVLRTKTTDDLSDYLAGPKPVETAWLSPARQHEEAWFLGLRLNAGVDVAALESEFGRAMVEPAIEAVKRMVESGMLVPDGWNVRLTAKGRLLSKLIVF